MRAQDLQNFIEKAGRLTATASKSVQNLNPIHESLSRETILVNPSRAQDAKAVTSIHSYQQTKQAIAHLLQLIESFVKKCKLDLKAVLWEQKTFTITDDELKEYDKALEQLRSLISRQNTQALSFKNLRKKSLNSKSLTFGHGQIVLKSLLAPEICEGELEDLDLSKPLQLVSREPLDEDPFAGFSSDSDESSELCDNLDSLSLGVETLPTGSAESVEPAEPRSKAQLYCFKDAHKGLFANEALDAMASIQSLKDKRRFSVS